MIALINAMLCLYIVLRAVTYQRHESSYRLIPSLLAYVLIVSSFWEMLDCLSGRPVSLPSMIVAGYIAYSLHNYKGNVSKLIGHRYIKHIYRGSHSRIQFNRGRK